MSHTAPARISLAGRAFVPFVGWTGLIVFAYSAWTIAAERLALQPEWLLFAALTLVSGRFTVKIPSVSARFSVSEMFAFSSVLLFGPASGAVILAIDSLIVSWRYRMNAAQTLFNFGNLALAAWTSGALFFATSGTGPLLNHVGPTEGLILPLALLTITYFLLNTALTAIAIGIHTRQPAFGVWRAHFGWVGPGYAAGASAALLLVVAMREMHFSALALLVPVIAVCYLMLRSSFGRLSDSEQHVAALNDLYLSTIETLATAIDAKDDVTHDHVRRVQGAAVALAGELGVTDPQLLKALEAAGLLHDTGKIAVPEHILNKPGRLTPAEFETMKLHAPIGAEILSSIRFPYPVVPIVRHHHENWDGTGYPDGLKGTDIPIGARILSVVDCFDALTSDRPYRGRMSDDDALAIIVQRRGTMYDPLIVDTFVRSWQRIMPATTPAVHPAARAVAAQKVPAPAPAPLATPETSPLEEMVAFTSLARAVDGEAGLADLGALVWLMVRPIVPATDFALFVPDQGGDVLTARFAAGPFAASLRNTSHVMSRGAVGWSAVNRRMIVNGEAASTLDHARADAASAPHWVCTLPLIQRGATLAVLAFYAPRSTPFSDQQAQLLELIAPRLAAAVASINTRHAAADPVRSTPSQAARSTALQLVHRA